VTDGFILLSAGGVEDQTVQEVQTVHEVHEVQTVQEVQMVQTVQTVPVASDPSALRRRLCEVPNQV